MDPFSVMYLIAVVLFIWAMVATVQFCKCRDELQCLHKGFAAAFKTRREELEDQYSKLSAECDKRIQQSEYAVKEANGRRVELANELLACRADVERLTAGLDTALKNLSAANAELGTARGEMAMLRESSDELSRSNEALKRECNRRLVKHESAQRSFLAAMDDLRIEREFRERLLKNYTDALDRLKVLQVADKQRLDDMLARHQKLLHTPVEFDEKTGKFVPDVAAEACDKKVKMPDMDALVNL